MINRTAFILAVPLLAGCTGTAPYSQGALQPQSVTGPCQVQRFYLLTTQSVPTQMTVSNTGGACTFTLINPALNMAVLNAALLTGAPTHGRAVASLVSGNTQAAVSYEPQRGYVGPDQFNVTIQPQAIGVTVNVTVQGGGA
jgi:hypothetical protein